jgi:putative tributyrin esterase
VSSIVTVEFGSRALARQTTYTAIVPSVGEPPFAVLYLLHGHDDDHHAWLHRSTLLNRVEALPLVVVLPSGENSYYVDAGPERELERLIVDELPIHLMRTFRVRDGKAAIGGLSMGGYGALRLGLRHPDRYASIVAHSSRLPTRSQLAREPWARGLDIDEHGLDIEAVAAGVEHATVPALRFDCGVDDHLLDDSRRFHARLDALGIPHRYTEHPGAHTWDYWEARLPEALAHHARALEL